MTIPSSPVTAHEGYRRDIDGLRALAVLSVVIYHLAKPWVPGGYVGVDIFFVISGFLITRNIWGEMQDGRFSLANFYLRRIRRIAPAFLVMAAATLAAGAILLLPGDLLGLAKSALWGVFSLSNVYFWRYLDTGYFAESSDEIPLLHTWSLGVEEQFYFLWPALLLLALWLFRRRAGAGACALAAVICVASYACGEIASVSAPKFAYYMLPARAGELMIGAQLALSARYRVTADARAGGIPWWSEALALAGFTLVGYSLYALDDTSRFPGINAIYPCVGAALLMLAGERRSRIVSLLLTSRPVVFVGLISYSLYLWHWPILAFVRYLNGGIDLPFGIAAVVAMAIAAYLSYRFVELPARRWRGTARRQVLVLYVLPSLALSLAAWAMVATGGMKRLIEASPLYRDRMASVAAFTAPASDFKYDCQLSTFDPGVLDKPDCVVAGEGRARRMPAVEPGILLWGDSQAAHYIGVIGAVLAQSGVEFRNATHSACPPVFAPSGYGIPAYRAGCDAFRPYMQSAILAGRYRAVVLSGAWDIYDTYPRFRADFERTVQAMTAKGLRVVLIGQAPYFATYNRNCELRGARIGGIDCRTRYTVPDAGPGRMDRYLAELATRMPNVRYLDIRPQLCKDGTCSPYVAGELAYHNATHLSMSGSWRIGAQLVRSPAFAQWSDALRGNDGAAPAVAPVSAPPPSPATVAGAADGGVPAARPMAPILGGYVPRFQHHVRSQNNAQSTAGPAGIVIEFWGTDIEAVAASIETDLAKLGFREVARGPSGAALRMDFAKAGYPKVSVNVGPMGTLTPQTHGAVGIAYFHW